MNTLIFKMDSSICAKYNGASFKEFNIDHKQSYNYEHFYAFGLFSENRRFLIKFCKLYQSNQLRS
jgi:hypothetical protein